MLSLRKILGKTITHRIGSIFITYSVVFLFTHEVALSIGITSVLVIFKMGWYFLHEILWEKKFFIFLFKGLTKLLKSIKMSIK